MARAHHPGAGRDVDMTAWTRRRNRVITERRPITLTRPSRSRGIGRSAIGSAASVLLVAGSLVVGGVVASAQDGAPAASPGGPTPTPLTVGLGYIPNVQFAQFYRAELAGYYDEAGLEVTFQNKIDPELITLLGQGAVDVGMADGTSIIPAVSQGIPVAYGTTVYARFPNVVFAREDSGIRSVADLAGRRIGIPGRFGSSWIMLQALLASEGLTTDDVEVVTYPDFGQGVAVAEGQVDAAVGFANNEPVQLEVAGIPVVLLRIDEVAPLPGPGLTVGRETLEAKGDAIRAFRSATLRAMAEIIEDPEVGLDATAEWLPELGDDEASLAVQRAVLEATVESWSSPYTDANGLGSIDPATWESAIEIMSTLPESVVEVDLTVDRLIVPAFAP
jgi:NitT/TauT family transport system substrate-binding protein